MSLFESQLQVQDFMLAAEQACPGTPTVPDNAILELRYKLMNEELQEFARAVTRHWLVGHAYDEQEILVEVADALCDLMYVTLGTAVAFGITLAPIFEAVHESNMQKFIDGHRREDGKYIKGPSWRPPPIKSLLEAQAV